MEMQLVCSIYACLLSDFPFPFNISRNNLETSLSTLAPRDGPSLSPKRREEFASQNTLDEKKGILFLKREKDRGDFDGKREEKRRVGR